MTRGGPTEARERPPAKSAEYGFSSHETSPCRYSWIAKALAERSANETRVDEGAAMTFLGIEENIVRGIRCWVTGMRLAEPRGHRQFTRLRFVCASMRAEPFQTLFHILSDSPTSAGRSLDEGRVIMTVRGGRPRMVALNAMEVVQPVLARRGG